jgi:hypothetical protein
MSDIRVPLTADQVAQIVAYTDESRRVLSLRDAMIRGIALGACSAKDLETCRFQVTDDAIVILGTAKPGDTSASQNPPAAQEPPL